MYKFCDVLVLVSCMLDSSCLLTEIGISQKEWHPNFFESEEGCRLLGSWIRDVR